MAVHQIGLKAAVPLVTARVSCGFPSPAEDHIDSSVDLNELMIQYVPATFIVQVKGDSMIDIGILPNDYAVVNKAVRPADKAVVVAIVDGEYTLKRYRRRGGRCWLQAENAKYKDMEIL